MIKFQNTNEHQADKIQGRGSKHFMVSAESAVFAKAEFKLGLSYLI